MAIAAELLKLSSFGMSSTMETARLPGRLEADLPKIFELSQSAQRRPQGP
jgi:hypothetical protein